MPHRTSSTKNYYERKINYDWPKIFISHTLFHFALTEGIQENVVLLNENKSTVKSFNYPSVLTYVNWYQF